MGASLSMKRSYRIVTVDDKYPLKQEIFYCPASEFPRTAAPYPFNMTSSLDQSILFSISIAHGGKSNHETRNEANM